MLPISHYNLLSTRVFHLQVLNANSSWAATGKGFNSTKKLANDFPLFRFTIQIVERSQQSPEEDVSFP